MGRRGRSGFRIQLPASRPDSHETSECHKVNCKGDLAGKVAKLDGVPCTSKEWRAVVLKLDKDGHTFHEIPCCEACGLLAHVRVTDSFFVDEPRTIAILIEG